ncbi:ABC transporter ATP-binding protein [Ancylobacter sonchi]|uniref:ABC transporter ATP-binding protein n=1 Tax=Ancylobacter sonchi TaxID=1937790 RepID=UPI001BD328EC|nr:ABC transporter ATP-binding protein [Ancylobacter sonchi]MBS7534768.1 ABC transporter ATP-binding protein [Ancylobacter sonchi]
MSDIDIRQLSKSYGAYHALRSIDLRIPNGTLLALLGPSGCGKSTTLQLLAGFDTPTGGEIRADGEVLSSPQRVIPPERRGISLVFQNYAVWPHKTVAENVAFGLQLRKLPRAELDARLARALDTVRLGALGDRYPFELSGGQQQRVALARALAVEPRILLLDEPLSNLDAHLREEMRFEIRRVHDELGITTVYVTHDQGEALVTADQVAVMKGGIVQQLGTPEQIFEQPANAFVASFIGSNNEIAGTIGGPGSFLLGAQPIAGVERASGTTGQQAVLCIRPSRVELCDARATGNVLDGVVKRSAYLGEYRDVLIEIGEAGTLRAFVAPDRRPQPGERVRVRLPPEHCQIFPAPRD